jgi:acetyl esterase/lipase
VEPRQQHHGLERTPGRAPRDPRRIDLRRTRPHTPAPTYIDVDSAEVFRDECVEFASSLWRDGGTAELHVWPGGTHGYDLLSPQSAIAQGAEHAREKWLARHLK